MGRATFQLASRLLGASSLGSAAGLGVETDLPRSARCGRVGHGRTDATRLYLASALAHAKPVGHPAEPLCERSGLVFLPFLAARLPTGKIGPNSRAGRHGWMDPLSCRRSRRRREFDGLRPAGETRLVTAASASADTHVRRDPGSGLRTHTALPPTDRNVGDF